MAQTTTTGSNSNLMASTPIRIGSGSGSFHGPHTGGTAQQAAGTAAGTGNESSSPGGTAFVQQSSSVPTAVGQLQSHAATMCASNQSLGVATGSTNITPPNSAGLRQTGAFDFKFMRRTSLKVLLPRLPSTDSLSNSPGPSSPGLANWATDTRDKYDGNQTDKTPGDGSKLNRKESYKAQRKNYRREKKRVASELLNSLQDPAVIVLADWLKVRGTLKSWTKLWCVLKPGHLLIYKTPKTKSSHWVGTILLTSCQVIERPSKKDGFCFKLFHPLEQSIWAPRGPDKETIGAVVQPLPTAYLIFRAPSQAAGKCWMDALELSLRCSALLLRSNSNSGAVQGTSANDSAQISHETQWSEADYEKHFNEHDLPPRVHRRKTSHSDLPKRYAQYLTVPGADGGKLFSSDTSLPSRSQTPIFQQLYETMTNWERIVANTADNKIRNLRKFRKTKHVEKDDFAEGVSSAGDFSDASSVDFSPDFQGQKQPTTLQESLKLRKRRLAQFTKSLSLGSTINTTSSSEDAGDDINAIGLAIPPSSTTKKPFILNVEDLDADSQNEGATALLSGLDTDTDSETGDRAKVEDLMETPYVELPEEEFGESGEQVEELGEENKSLIWILIKQIRPGMDLSKVVLPTFILEPRSFLDKLSDSYYHADILSSAVHEDDPFTRMKLVVQWYLSGFYKKPKGLKKPYNPILGETFRCYWQHPDGSRTYYIAEQVSHHPPISAFYVTNRQDGFCISCSILAKSKFYGNSTSAVLEGVATLTLLPRGESYTLTTPYANCTGILMGTLSMELGGKITIECENTGYKTDLEFKLKPLFGGAGSTNLVTGKIKLGKETLASIHGHWDTDMYIKDVKTSEETLLFAANKEMKQKRLKRFVVPLDSQLPNESERLWQLVSVAIRSDDQQGATEEKTVLEEAQRIAAKERGATLSTWHPSHFTQDLITGEWLYKYADLRPWDQRNDVKQYEANYKVLTKTRLQAPMIRTTSIMSNDPLRLIRTESRQSLAILKAKRRSKSIVQMKHEIHTDSSQSASNEDDGVKAHFSRKSVRKLMVAIEHLNSTLDDHTRQLALIHAKLERLQYAPPRQAQMSSSSSSIMSIFPSSLPRTLPEALVIKAVIYAFVAVFVCICIKWLIK